MRDALRLRVCAAACRPIWPQLIALGLIALCDVLSLTAGVLTLFEVYPTASANISSDVQAVLVKGWTICARASNVTLVSTDAQNSTLDVGPITCVVRKFAGTSGELPNVDVQPIVAALANTHNVLRAVPWVVAAGITMYGLGLAILWHLRRQRRREAGRSITQSGCLRSLGSRSLTAIFAAWTWFISGVYLVFTLFSRGDARSVEGMTTTVQSGFDVLCASLGLASIAFGLGVYGVFSHASEDRYVEVDIEAKTAPGQLEQLTELARQLSNNKPGGGVMGRSHPLKRHGRPDGAPAVPPKPKRSWSIKLGRQASGR